MRIVYIHQYFSTPAGSSGTRSYEFARYLVGRGHKVTMITGVAWLKDLRRTGLVTRTVIDGIDVAAIGVRYSNYMGFLRRAWSFVAFMLAAAWVARREPCDVVFATSTPLTVGIPGWLAARKHRVPFVFEVRDLWPDILVEMGAFTNPVLRWAALRLESFLYRKADHIVALSPGMADDIAEHGVSRERLTVIPNCADTHVFSPGPKDAGIVERYALEGAFVVGFVGALGIANDIGQLLEAARIVQDDEAGPGGGGAARATSNAAPARSASEVSGAEGGAPATRPGTRTVFMLVGDGRMRPALEDRARELGLTNIVWTGFLPKTEIVGVLRTLDVAVVTLAPLPLMGTSSPNKLFDALAAGRPVVINFGGWLEPVLEDARAGVGTTPGVPAELARTLMELRDDTDRRDRMGQAARQLAETRFARAEMAAQLEDVLSDAVARR